MKTERNLTSHWPIMMSDPPGKHSALAIANMASFPGLHPMRAKPVPNGARKDDEPLLAC